MRNNILKITFWLILLFLSLKLGANLRLAGYNVIPEPYIILDEHTNVWHGISLRKTGVPTAWSILPFYINQSKIIGAGGPLDGFNLSVDERKPTLDNFSTFPKPVVGLALFDFGRGVNNIPLVQPYLDHPPFGAYVLGLFVPDSVKTFQDVTDYDLRQSSLYLAIITQALIFLFVFQTTKKPLVGIIASTVYGTVPSYLLLSRYALLENVLSPLILIGLILLIFIKDKLDENKNNNLIVLLLILAGIIGGFGALTKLVGWIFILSNIILLCIWKFKFKNILLYAIPAILIGSLYFAWGFYLSLKLFVDLFLTQSNRDFIGSINLLVTFFRVSIYRFPIDGWWIGGFISLLFIPKHKKYLPLGVGILATLFSALCIVGSNYPWYFIPLIPFTAIAIGLFFDKFTTHPSFISIMLVFFTFVSSSFYWGLGVYQKVQPFNLYKLLFIIFIAMGIFWSYTRNTKKYQKVWFVGVILLFIGLTLLNRRSMFYILENWGKLPLIYTPGTF